MKAKVCVKKEDSSPKSPYQIIGLYTMHFGDCHPLPMRFQIASLPRRPQ